MGLSGNIQMHDVYKKIIEYDLEQFRRRLYRFIPTNEFDSWELEGSEVILTYYAHGETQAIRVPLETLEMTGEELEQWFIAETLRQKEEEEEKRRVRELEQKEYYEKRDLAEYERLKKKYEVKSEGN